MINTLTTKSWLATLDRIVENDHDHTLTTLAAMLRDVIHHSDDPHIEDILDSYALHLLGSS
jgi:hypothetical protein